MSHIVFTTHAVLTAQVHGPVGMFDFISDKMDVDATSLIKAGARKLHGGTVELYGLFEKDRFMPAGKRGKFQEDVEMRVADDVLAKPGFFTKRVRFLRALAKSKLKPFKKPSKAGQLMDVDDDYDTAPATFMFTFSSRSMSPERAREGPGAGTQLGVSTSTSTEQSATAATEVPASMSQQYTVDSPASINVAIDELASALSRVQITPPIDENRSGHGTASGAVVDSTKGEVREPAFDPKHEDYEAAVVSVAARGEEGQAFAAVPEDLMEQYQLEAFSKAQAGGREVGDSEESATPPVVLEDSKDKEIVSSVVVSGKASQDIEACEAEGAVAHIEPSAAFNDTPSMDSGGGPLLSSLSISISSLTVARNPSPVVPDEDEENPKALLIVLTTADDVDETESPLSSSVDEGVVEPEPADDDSNDTLVTVFVELPSHEQNCNKTSSAEGAIACPAPTDNTFDSTTLSTDQPSSDALSDSPSVTVLSVHPALVQALTVADPFSTVDEQEDDWGHDASDMTDDDDGEEEVWYEVSNMIEDEDVIWHECEDSFKPVVQDFASAPAQYRFPQHDSRVLSGSLYDHDDKIDVDLAGDLRILCAHLTTSVARLGSLITSWLAISC
ncbi:hypothetical protein C8T65DRAFT_831692 [Cerioporus squamosus]|nr:hypothetical protein C8T65DRAFT_831692 [Cerioporus squamosus]